MSSVYEAPKDYAEVFVRYFEPMKVWVYKRGIPATYAEDVAMEVLIKFMERDELKNYDPTLLHGVEKKPASFTAFIRGFANIYCLNYRDRIIRDSKRNAPGMPDYADKVDLSRPFEDRIETSNELAQIFDLAEKRMRGAGRKSRQWDLAVAFRLCGESVERYGKIERKWVAEQLGVKVARVGKILTEMREVLADELAKKEAG